MSDEERIFTSNKDKTEDWMIGSHFPNKCISCTGFIIHFLYINTFLDTVQLVCPVQLWHKGPSKLCLQKRVRDGESGKYTGAERIIDAMHSAPSWNLLLSNTETLFLAHYKTVVALIRLWQSVARCQCGSGCLWLIDLISVNVVRVTDSQMTPPSFLIHLPFCILQQSGKV